MANKNIIEEIKGNFCNMYLVQKMDEEISKDFYINFFYSLEKNQFNTRFLTEDKNLILEKYGLFPYIDDYCNVFCNYVIEQIKNNNNDFVIFGNIFKDIPNIFFKQTFISLKYEKSNNYCYSGYYQPMNNNFLKNEQKLNVVEIHINLSCKRYVLRETLKNIIAHELTHAYEDWQRCCHNAKGYMTKEYERLHQEYDEFQYKLMPQILYYLSDFESRAYVASFYVQLKGKIDRMRVITPKKILSAVKNTPIYSKYQWIFKNVMAFKSPRVVEEAKDSFLEAYNDLTNSNCKNYNALVNILENKLNQCWYQFRNNASKIAYDLYLEKCPPMIPNSNKIFNENYEKEFFDFLNKNNSKPQ